jgi:hypothetical protein
LLDSAKAAPERKTAMFIRFNMKIPLDLPAVFIRDS